MTEADAEPTGEFDSSDSSPITYRSAVPPDTERTRAIRAARDLAEGLFLVHDALWKLARQRVGLVAVLMLIGAATFAVVGGFVGAALARW